MDKPDIGHNQGPETDVFSALDLRTDELVTAANQWLEKVPEIQNEDTANACKDFVDQLRAHFKIVDDARKEAKKPHDDAGKAVQAKFAPTLDRLKKAGELLKPKLTAWARKLDDERRAKAEVERKAAEEKAAEAVRLAAKSDDSVEGAVAAEEAEKAAQEAIRAASRTETSKTGIGGTQGRATGLRTYWTATVLNQDMAYTYVRDDQGVVEAIQKAVDARVRAGERDIPGVVITEDKRVA